ncbi:uncharacterized protein LOC144578083 [Callithrix jacchus]
MHTSYSRAAQKVLVRLDTKTAWAGGNTNRAPCPSLSSPQGWLLWNESSLWAGKEQDLVLLLLGTLPRSPAPSRCSDGSSASSPGAAFPRQRGVGGVPGFLGVERSGLRNCPYSTTPLAPASTSLSLPPGRARARGACTPGSPPKRASWKGAIHHLPFRRILARAQPGNAPPASPKDTCASKLCQNPASDTPQKPRAPAACPTLAPQRSLQAWHLPSGLQSPRLRLLQRQRFSRPRRGNFFLG